MKRRFWTVVFLTAALAGLGAGAAEARSLPKGRAGNAYFPAAVSYPDAYETDDSTTTARVLPDLSYHSIHTDADEDWFKITATATDTPFALEVMLDGGSGEWDTVITVHELDANGVPVEIAMDDDSDYFWTYASMMMWKAPHPGTFYVKVSGYAGGTGNYWLWANRGIGHRVHGADRYETAARVSQLMFSSNGGTALPDVAGTKVVLATGEDFPDALAGSVLAGWNDSSILLTRRYSLPASTLSEIWRLLAATYYAGGETTVYIVGGDSAVSPAVAARIASIPIVKNVVRLQSDDRYTTAAMIAKTAEAEYDLGRRAYVVSGGAWPDGLAAAPVAMWDEGPLLLTRAQSLPAQTRDVLKKLRINQVVIVGGPLVVDPDVEDEIRSAIGSGTVTRIAGTSRYETARRIAQYGVDVVGMPGDNMTLVSGENWSDGACAAPISWWSGGPMLLTTPRQLSPQVKTFMRDNGPWNAVPENNMSYLVGGPSSVNGTAYGQWKGAYSAPLPPG